LCTSPCTAGSCPICISVLASPPDPMYSVTPRTSRDEVEPATPH
jgi:hypothetical protein